MVGQKMLASVIWHPPGPLGHKTCGLKNRSWFGNASLVHTHLVERICITGRCPCFFAGNPTLDLVRSLSFRTTIWVCTFANNQFGEAFGATILQTPFVKAVEMAEATILMVDRDAGSLRRSWCCLELHCTILKEKSLELYTSAGAWLCIQGGNTSEKTSHCWTCTYLINKLRIRHQKEIKSLFVPSLAMNMFHKT